MSYSKHRASMTCRRRTVAGLSALGVALSLLICLLASPSPVASQGIVPTATPAPEEISPPPPTPAPAQPSDTSGGNESEEQSLDLFFEMEGDPPPGPNVETLVSRFAGFDFGQLDPSLGRYQAPRVSTRWVVSRLRRSRSTCSKMLHSRAESSMWNRPHLATHSGEG